MLLWAVIVFGCVILYALIHISNQLAGLREDLQKIHDEIQWMEEGQENTEENTFAKHLRWCLWEELLKLNDMSNKLDQIERNTNPYTQPPRSTSAPQSGS